MFILAVAAWWLWHLEQSEAQSRLARTVDLLREQSLRAFELQDALLIAVPGLHCGDVLGRDREESAQLQISCTNWTTARVTSVLLES